MTYIKGAKMILITTSKSFLLLDHKSGEFKKMHSSGQHYYGITRHPEGWLVGHRNRSNASPIPKHQERGELLLFDHDFALKRTIQAPFPLRDIHQILMHDGVIYVTCTFDNMIAIFDGEWREWHPLGEVDAAVKDINHFNSISPNGDDIIIVAHNLGRPSEMMVFDRNDLHLRRSVQLGLGAHNAWFHESELMTCSSAEGRLLGANGSVVETGGFPRGIAYLSDEIVVGLSEFKTLEDRDNSRGTILVYDRNWTLLRRFDLGQEGMVTDIIALNA